MRTKLTARRTHQGGQLLIDHLDNLLGRIQALQDLRVHGPCFDLADKVLDYLVVDICLKQRQADLSRDLVDVSHSADPGYVSRPERFAAFQKVNQTLSLEAPLVSIRRQGEVRSLLCHPVRVKPESASQHALLEHDLTEAVRIEGT